MRKRLQGAPAIVIAVVALVMAMTGSAVAAGLITGRDIQNGSITRADIHNATLGINKLTDSARHQLQGQRGATGPRGPRGATGHTGPAGPSFVHVVRQLSDKLPWGKYEGGGARVGVHDGHALLYNFTDGLNQDADLKYNNLDGLTLNDIAGLKYSEMSQADDPAGPDNHPGAYLFLYTTATDGTKHTVAFAPTSTHEGQWYQWDVLAQQVGYGDGSNPGIALATKSDWNTMIGQHGTDVINAFYIGVGTENSATNSNTYVDDVQFEVDGETSWYDFGG